MKEGKNHSKAFPFHMVRGKRGREQRVERPVVLKTWFLDHPLVNENGGKGDYLSLSDCGPLVVEVSR